MFFWAKTQTLSAVMSFPTFTGNLDPLTGSSDPLEVSITPFSIATPPSAVLHFPQNMDFLQSTLLASCVTL